MRGRNIIVGAWLVLAAACATTKVERMDERAVKDLSGRWNDTDSRLVAEEMIQDSLSRPWLPQSQARMRRNPSVIVTSVRNQSMEHINTDTFVEDLQRSLINSGQVEFVASGAERGAIRNERADQDIHASEQTRKAHGQETGADYALSGVINAIQDREGGDYVMFYQINLKLVDMRTNQIVWNGQKKIKKYVSRPSTSF